MEKGAPILQVQNHLRHSQITTTTKYLHNYNKEKDNSTRMILDYIFEDKTKDERATKIEAIKHTIDRLSEGDLMKLSNFIESL